jgi:hypothetical protein
MRVVLRHYVMHDIKILKKNYTYGGFYCVGYTFRLFEIISKMV